MVEGAGCFCYFELVDYAAVDVDSFHREVWAIDLEEAEVVNFVGFGVVGGGGYVVEWSTAAASGYAGDEGAVGIGRRCEWAESFVLV